MTYAELITQVKSLSLEERLRLVETIMHLMREDLGQLSPEARAEARRQRLQAASPASSVRGLGKSSNAAPEAATPQVEYVDYLERKYS
jgi:hypothetical protein